MNFTMERKYAPMAGRGFWARQFSRAGATTARVIRRGITSDDGGSPSTVTPEPGTPGGAPSKMPLYAGLGVGAVVLLILFGRK
jgi:hypothetical protein